MSASVRVASKLHRFLPRIGLAASVTVFIIALAFLHGEFRGIDFGEVRSHLTSHAWSRLAGASILTALAYAFMTGYDVLALRYVGRSLSYTQIALTSFAASAITHNVGLGALSGGSIRYRRYSVAGLTAVSIARIIGFVTLTFAVGSAALSGIAIGMLPDAQLLALNIAPALARVTGVTLFALAIAYVTLPLFRSKAFAVGNWRLEIPPFGITCGQAALSIADLVCTSAALYVLLAPELPIGYLPFLAVYMAALTAGVLSSLPGGIGVFEAVLLVALPNVDREALLSTIIVFRLIYYVAPLMIALLLLAGDETQRYHPAFRRIGSLTTRGLAHIVPWLTAGLVFLAGVVLLISGSTPAISARLQLVARLVPLPLLELSHLAGSVVGVVLLVLAHGLANRLHRAYAVTLMALALGCAASLLKGFDYEEAIVLVAVAGVLWLARAQFHRRGAILRQHFSFHWAVIIAVALGGAIWLGMINYRHVPYSGELWWQFSLHGDAPRFLRASLLTVVIAMVFALGRVLRPAPPPQREYTSEEQLRLRQILGSAHDPAANAALIGDKRLLFNDAQTAFIMYQISGRSWVALGDPVGPRSEHASLVWRYRELCDRYDGWPVYYQITDTALPLYIDMGLTLSKLGEDGYVDLATFTLQGGAMSGLRQVHNRAQRDGARFEVIRRAGVAPLLPDLRVISDEWLASKAAAEKGFSLGRFSASYLQEFDCAIVRVDGAIVAFANLWPAPAGRVLSIDLMRHGDAAPRSVMDYLFVELILYAQEQGYQWFSLGMTPLAGLEHHALATVWHKIGNLIYQSGENFYNFEGLRRYKEKFHPQWRPRYLACPGGLAVPRVLLDTAILVSGGVRKVFTK